MQEPRVVYVSATATAYGGENALTDLVLKIRAQVDPIVVCPEDGPLLDALKASDIQTRVVPFPVLDRKYFHPARIFIFLAALPGSILRLRRLLRELSPSIVHSNNVLILPAALASKSLGIPHIWHIREIIERHHIHPLLWKIWRWLILTCSDRVVCISRAVQEQFEGSGKAVVIQDGVDIRLFRPDRSRGRSRSRKQKEVLVGIVGRLDHRRKGQDTFIQAASIASRSHPNLRFVIAGHARENMGEKESRLYDLVMELGMEKIVEFTGFIGRDRMPELIKRLDIVVLCSRKPEGLGIVLLEGMSCGKSVISFAEGGPLDIIDDTKNGMLVEPGNVQSLAAAMVKLAGNPKMRRALGTEGRKTVESRFSDEETARNILKLYSEVLSARG